MPTDAVPLLFGGLGAGNKWSKFFLGHCIVLVAASGCVLDDTPKTTCRFLYRRSPKVAARCFLLGSNFL